MVSKEQKESKWRNAVHGEIASLCPQELRDLEIKWFPVMLVKLGNLWQHRDLRNSPSKLFNSKHASVKFGYKISGVFFVMQSSECKSVITANAFTYVDTFCFIASRPVRLLASLVNLLKSFEKLTNIIMQFCTILIFCRAMCARNFLWITRTAEILLARTFPLYFLYQR